MEAEQLRETIESVKNAVLIVGEEKTEEKFLLREALSLFLNSKDIFVSIVPPAPEEIKTKWSPLVEEKFFTITRDVVNTIKIPKKKFFPQEIEYEEDENFLKINLISKDGHIDKNDIFVEQEPLEFDIAFCFSNPKHEEISKYQNIAIKKEAIFIVPDKEKTLAEKIYEIIEKTSNNIEEIKDTKIPSLLMASLVLETENFRKKINQNIFYLGYNLLDLGADKNLIEQINKNEISLFFAQILGRALARTRIDESLKSYWTFLSKEDFERAKIKNPSTELIFKIASEVSKITPLQPNIIVLWQIKESVFAVMLKNNHEAQKIILGPYKNFSEGEISIRKSLKDSLL